MYFPYWIFDVISMNLRMLWIFDGNFFPRARMGCYPKFFVVFVLNGNVATCSRSREYRPFIFHIFRISISKFQQNNNSNNNFAIIIRNNTENENNCNNHKIRALTSFQKSKTSMN